MQQVEGLLGQLSARDQAAYPPLLVLATASAHVLAAYRLHFYAQVCEYTLKGFVIVFTTCSPSLSLVF